MATARFFEHHVDSLLLANSVLVKTRSESAVRTLFLIACTLTASLVAPSCLALPSNALRVFLRDSSFHVEMEEKPLQSKVWFVNLPNDPRADKIIKTMQWLGAV